MIGSAANAFSGPEIILGPVRYHSSIRRRGTFYCYSNLCFQPVWIWPGFRCQVGRGKVQKAIRVIYLFSAVSSSPSLVAAWHQHHKKRDEKMRLSSVVELKRYTLDESSCRSSQAGGNSSLGYFPRTNLYACTALVPPLVISSLIFVFATKEKLEGLFVLFCGILL